MITYTKKTACQVETFDDKAKITVSMSDFYHDITVVITVALPNGEIIEAEAEFLRPPDMLCSETKELMPRLKGVVLGKGIRKKTMEVLGGADGCVHLRELVIAAAEAFYQERGLSRGHSFDSLRDYKNWLTLDSRVICHFNTENAKRLQKGSPVNPIETDTNI